MLFDPESTIIDCIIERQQYLKKIYRLRIALNRLEWGICPIDRLQIPIWYYARTAWLKWLLSVARQTASAEDISNRGCVSR